MATDKALLHSDTELLNAIINGACVYVINNIWVAEEFGFDVCCGHSLREALSKLIDVKQASESKAN